MPNSCPSAHDSQLLLVQLVQAHAVDNQESHVPSLICCRADFKSLMKGHAHFLWVIEQEGIFTVCVCLCFFFFFCGPMSESTAQRTDAFCDHLNLDLVPHAVCDQNPFINAKVSE